ncbi:MAG: response regulator [Lentisphaerales bacterium]|nr:response regulator [Lentisphaerales bacterium]
MNKIKILFVDDQPLVLCGIKRMLRDLRDKRDVHYVENGIDALNFLRNESADGIVSDMRMPSMDGATVLKLARSRSPETVRVILSG